MKWFVMLRGHNRGVPIPMSVEGEEPLEIRLFDSEEAAEKAGRESPLGAHYSFEVYEWDP